MRSTSFYDKFDKSIPRIQDFAFKLTKNFENARLLYLETAHQAMKHGDGIEAERFDEWLLSTMKMTYCKMLGITASSKDPACGCGS